LGSIADLLVNLYQMNINVAAIIYMHKIDDNRTTGSLLRNLRLLADLCGQPAMPNVVITMWSRVDADDGTQREQELRTFWKDILDNGGRTERFNGTYESAWGIIGSIMQNNAGTTVTIQQEMAYANTPPHDIAAKPNPKNFVRLVSGRPHREPEAKGVMTQLGLLFSESKPPKDSNQIKTRT